jgi:C1A family cysteine protease
MEGTVSEDAGASIRDGMKSVANQGVCPESEWPYNIKKFTVKPTKQCYTDALKFRSVVYRSVPQNLNSIKSALATARGVVFGISVYESFESDAVAKTGIVPLPAKGEKMLGGHCVRLVGYTDSGLADVPAGYFIGMNSWGTGWGLKGFFALPYAYVTNPNLASDLWVVNAVS